jgi:hypothetical protein
MTLSPDMNGPGLSWRFVFSLHIALRPDPSCETGVNQALLPLVTGSPLEYLSGGQA